MIYVREKFRLKTNHVVRACNIFQDDIITEKIETEAGVHTRFEVLQPKCCFGKPDDRHIVLSDIEDFSGIKTVRFID